MNSKLSRLKYSFLNGELSKADFVRDALAIHDTLFGYVDITRETDVHEITVNSDGVRFIMGAERITLYCPPHEARVAPIEVMNFGRYEPEETAVMDLLSSEAKCILDVGANLGWYSIRFAKRLPESKVYAFEPLPTSHAYLQRNVAANSVGAQVTCFNHGLSETGGTVEFFVSPTAGTNASLKNVASAPDAQSIVGLVLTMDQWCSNQRVAPDFIKCDVEGAELLVFRGAEQTLISHHPIVFAELLRKWSKPFGYHPNDMLAFFARLGYRCFAVGPAGTRALREVTDETQETNYAFLHEKRHSDLIRTLESMK